MSDTSSWTVSHQIPLALLVGLSLQTAGAFWWASKVDTTLDHIAERVSDHEQKPRHASGEQANGQLVERVVKLEVVVSNQTEVLREIRDILREQTRRSYGDVWKETK